MGSDLFYIFTWWATIFLIGIIFLRFTTAIFSNFFDSGYIFSKVLGLVFVSYAIFLLGLSHLLPFTQFNILIILFLAAIANYIFLRKKTSRETFLNHIRKTWKIFLFEEILFFLTLAFWSYVKSFQPEIHGLEKFMDYGFINSILRAEYFPPRDMWLTPFPINYYYFGHFITAVLTKLSGIPPFISYNLMLATIFAFTFTGAFSIGANLIRRISPIKAFIGGLLSGFLVTLAGNLHTIYAFFEPYPNETAKPIWQLVFSPSTFPNSYWYPNATRFIYNTIHEFPSYSFVVSDLHGHVLDIPLVLLTIALLLSMFLSTSEEQSRVHSSKFKILKNIPQLLTFNFKLLTLLGFLLATMYMTNAWDGIIYLLLSVIVVYYLSLKLRKNEPDLQTQNSKLKTQNYNSKFKIFNFDFKFFAFHFSLFTFILFFAFYIFSRPFSLNFKAFVSGIGVLCAPSFLTNLGKFGPFLFEKDHCQHSPLWQLATLYGFFYFWAISFIFLISKKINSKSEARNFRLPMPCTGGQAEQYQNTNDKNSKRFGHSIFENWNLFRYSNFDIRILNSSDLFVLILIFLSTILILIPEFFYIKDIYPAHYRANTMFKLAYQAFIMLSISSAYIIIRVVSSIKYSFGFAQNKHASSIRKKMLVGCYLMFATTFLFLVMIYPFFSVNSYFGNLKTYHGLNGLSYLEKLYPTDYKAIEWINKNIKGQPVILEAQGDSYTDYARVSANTGLPTVLGWTVHEWLWRKTYDVPAPRIPEVQSLYDSVDILATKELIKKYNIELVFVGDLERQKYPNMSEKKFEKLGKIIFQKGQTKIYKIQI